MSLSATVSNGKEEEGPGQLPSKPMGPSLAKRLHSPSPCPEEVSVPIERDADPRLEPGTPSSACTLLLEVTDHSL